MHQQQFLALCVSSAHSANTQGQYDLAIEWCQQAIQLMPDLPEAWYNLGLAYSGQGLRELALGALKKSASYAANSADAQNSIGLLLLDLDKLPEAEQCFHRALSLEPNFALAHSNLGKLHEKQKQIEKAEASFRKAVALQPDLAPAYSNLCGILNTQQKYEAAEEAARKALAHDPRLPHAWNNFGNTLFSCHRYDAAETATRNALELDPQIPEAWRNLGRTLLQKKKYKDAIDCYRRALELSPNLEYLPGILLHTRMIICEWAKLAEDISLLIREISHNKNVSSPFHTIALTPDPALQRKVAENWASEFHPVNKTLPNIKIRSAAGKIRIAYFSADFHDHATTYLMAELFELHDKKRFELIAFSFGAEQKESAMRMRAISAFDQFIDVGNKTDKEIALLSREMRVDIAIDLKGFTFQARAGIFAYRVAPICVSYLGYPGTMGAEYIDYLIADHTLIPEKHQKHYAEKIVYLPNSYQVNDRNRVISDKRYKREDLDLPPTGFVYCCFNNNYKITPGTFDIWMRILLNVEEKWLRLFEQLSPIYK